MDKASRDVTVPAPKSVGQGDVNALKLGFDATHAVIAASIVLTSNCQCYLTQGFQSILSDCFAAIYVKCVERE